MVQGGNQRQNRNTLTTWSDLRREILDVKQIENCIAASTWVGLQPFSVVLSAVFSARTEATAATV
jgi:hypothetical protein